MNERQSADPGELERGVRELAPWHHDIELTADFSTGQPFSPNRRLKSSENDGVTLISPRDGFLEKLGLLYPDGMAGKSFLDCACNAGGYCFWAREHGATRVLGFDVREHWIKQAQFVLENRSSHPVDGIDLRVMDLYDLDKLEAEEFDLTYFSGIFYHLPDPITGLRLAAERTKDVLVLNTAMMPESATEGSDLAGMTMALEGTEEPMSGVYELSWFPNNPRTLQRILRWLGFEETLMTREKHKTVPKTNLTDQANELLSNRRRRVTFYAARERGRLAALRRSVVAGDVDT